MPTIEDYFDDDSDLPLPSSSRQGLQGSGLQGALLEEISTDDPDVPELDYDLLADQGRGIYGEGNKAPPARADAGMGMGMDVKGKGVARAGDELRPQGGQGGIDPKSAMGGFMGDMMKLQKAEDERLEKLRRQMGGATIAANPEVYKE
jgi:signal recognition particle subunit SRP19